IDRTRFAIRDAQRLAMTGRTTPDPRHATSALRVAPPLTLTVAEAEEGAAILESALRSTR
ncbi:hypothetical protein ACVNF4_36165, partial [Streptomyces sp. S6]